MFFGNRARVEELFHQPVVTFGDHLDQLFVRLFRRILHVVGNLTLFAFSVSAELVGVGLHVDDIDYT